MEEKCLLTPHPDIELGVERKPIEYFLTFPDKGINANTGLIFIIPGYEQRADSEYHKDKLRPYLANKYNCIAVGVNYFGAKLHALELSEIEFQLLDISGFVTAVYDMFGISQQDYVINGILQLDVLSQILAHRGCKRLGMEFRVSIKNRNDINEYQSFGLLPAIDHLQVLGEVLRKYEIDRKRLVAFGSSYGGYVALLLGKFAPNTFSVIIDNSGFIKTNIRDIATVEVPKFPSRMPINGIEYPKFLYSPWTIVDDTSPYYFSDNHRCIRNLLINDHIAKTPTRYNIFHSIEDTLISVKEKDKFVAMLWDKGIEVYYKVVKSDDIDGRLFKSLEHGMNASLRGVFDLVADRDSGNLCKADSFTDFDRESHYEFICPERAYVFSYSKDFTMKVEIVR